MRAAILAFCTCLAACGSCSKDTAPETPDAVAPLGSTSATVVAEPLPRCRKSTERLPIPGEEVIVGDIAVASTGLLAGIVRMNGGKRVASILKAPLALDSQTTVDIGTPIGDDPPPSPRWNGTTPWVAFIASHSADAGAKQRELRIAQLGDSGLAGKAFTILTQADESTAFDVAWTDGGAGLFTWDEDGPPIVVKEDGGAPAKKKDSVDPTPARGIVKVQALTDGATARIASPDTSDADSPKLIARANGGFWLAWLARKPDEEASGVEGPGEPRQFRWVEVIPLTATGEPAGPVRRASSEKGRAVAFELARSGDDLVVVIQDEIAASEGGGARIVGRRLKAGSDKPEPFDVVKDGVGHALSDVVPSANGDAAHWIAWSDTSEHDHLTPLGASFAPGHATTEPALEGTRVLASAADAVFALAGVEKAQPELLRYLCPAGSP